MRNAALVLGIIAGVIGMFVGLFGYGWTTFVEQQPEAGTIFGNFHNPGFVRFASVAAPTLAIAGGGMAKIRALWGGVLLIASAVMMYLAFTFNAATMFPIVMAGLGGFFAIMAGKPDEPKSHF